MLRGAPSPELDDNLLRGFRTALDNNQNNMALQYCYEIIEQLVEKLDEPEEELVVTEKMTGKKVTRKKATAAKKTSAKKSEEDSEATE